MTLPVNEPTVELSEFSGHTPGEVCRRLRHASVLISSVEMPSVQREMVLRRARHVLSGTMRKLDTLIAEVCAAPTAMDEQLTEPHRPDRIEPVL